MFFVFSTKAQKINQFDANGKRTGIWKKFYDNNKIRYAGQFKDGKEIGIFKFYSPSSALQPIIVKVYSGDFALVKFYNELGKLKTEGKMKGKNRVGKWTYYFTNGKIFSEEEYINGKLDGVLKNYYSNGKITLECLYKNGKKNGYSKTYTDTGVLIEEVSYLNGKLDGEGKYYDLKGELKEKGRYKEGKRDGKWEFYMDGEIVTKKKRTKLSELKNK